MTGTAVFVDTSIQIARFFHAPETKTRIQQRIAQYDICATSLVVKQEFKRRVLKEARYLLSLFRRHQSLAKVRRHVDSFLPQQQNRKRNICLNLLDTIGESDNAGEDDREQADRAELLLEALIEHGLEDFGSTVDHVFDDSGCACGLEPVRIDNAGRVSLGEEKCSKVASSCGVGAFLRRNNELLQKILGVLKQPATPSLTDELRRIAAFTEEYLSDPVDVEKKDPCATVGDLLIALESQSIRTFYTLNRAESRVLCPCLGQTLVVRPNYYARDDEVYAP